MQQACVHVATGSYCGHTDTAVTGCLAGVEAEQSQNHIELSTVHVSML